MASPKHNMSMQNLSVPYMPKLQYRTRPLDGAKLPESASISPISPVSTSFSMATVSTAPTSSRSSNRSSSPNTKKATHEITSPSDAKSSSVPSSHPSPTLPEKNSKKRGGSFFGFFSVKEPSQQAFDDYQRQLRKKGAIKNGRASMMGLPGVSSAQLPPTVPKVNSRWDGLPKAMKEKEKQKQTNSSQSIGGRNRSIRTSGSETSTSTTPSSTRSRGSSLNSKTRGLQHPRATNPTDLYGWETGSGSSGSITRKDTKAHDEAFQRLSIPSSPNPHFAVSPAPPLPSKLPEVYSKQMLADPGLLLGPSSYSSSPTRSNINSSPVSSITLSLPKKSSYVQPDGCAKSGQTSTAEIPDTDEIIITSKGLHILGPPAGAGQNARDSPFLAGEAEEVDLSRKDTPPDTASTRQAMSHGSSSYDPFFASSNDINPESWVAKGAVRNTANTDRSACDRSGADMNSICQAVAPWEDPSPKINDGSKKQCRSLPTPDRGQKLRKKSKMGIFSR